MPCHRQRDQFAHDVDQKVLAADVTIFVRKNCIEILFAKLRQQLTGYQDRGTKHPDSQRIINLRRFQESNPGGSLESNSRERNYGRVSAHLANSINRQAEADQPEQNKHSPSAYDPTSDLRRDAELPALRGMPPPDPKRWDRKSTRLNSSHIPLSRMPSSV